MTGQDGDEILHKITGLGKQAEVSTAKIRDIARGPLREADRKRRRQSDRNRNANRKFRVKVELHSYR